MNDMEKRSMIAIALSFIVLLFWWGTVQKKAPMKPAAVKTRTSAAAPAPKTSEEKTNEPAAAAPARGALQKENEGTFQIKNGKFRCLVGKKTGRIRHLFMTDSIGEVDLIMPGEPAPFRFFARGSELSNPLVTKDGETVTLNFNGALAALGISEKGLTLDLKAENGGPVSAVWCGGLGTDPDMLKQMLKRHYLRFHYRTAGKVRRLTSKTSESSYEWAAISNRYFLAAFFPRGASTVECDPKNPVNYLTFSSASGNLKLGILPGEKKYFALKKRGIGLEKTVNLGIFSFLSVWFIYILQFFYGLTGNYGWSIILLTLIVQGIMYPLSMKNIKSADAMKRIQPYVKKLQQQHKGDPKRLNEELMNLYRVQKVNPLGGCLPLVIQIPIFWSLFTLLQGLVELRGAPFIFWLKDLSRPDVLFGHVPSFIPIIAGWPIGPLPLLMGLTMFLQQKMTITDPQQKAFLLMPVFFTFIFIKFPSGLVLYWFTSNLITLGETMFHKRRSS